MEREAAMRGRRVGYALLIVLALGGLPRVAVLAQEAPVRNVIDRSQQASNETSSFSVVALPVPITNPAIGDGLGLAGAFLYKLDADSPASYTGIGGLYTDKHSWAIGAAQKTNFGGDRFHVNAYAFYYDFHYDFFGIGEAAGAQSRSVPIIQSGEAFVPEALVRLWSHVFVGLRYRYLTAKTSIDLRGAGQQPHLALPRAQLNITSSGLGPVFEYDSRNDSFSPTDGSYARIQANFAERAFLTSQKGYQTVDAAYNGYRSVSKNSVIAYRFSLCSASSTTPFFDLCSYGSNNDLRGYTPGQYRDKTSFAAQAEYRWRFYDPFGLVVFGGIGGVAPSFSQFEFDKLLPGGGVGLRYPASKKYNVNIGFDIAVGKRTSAYYFRIGEAF